MRNQGEVMTGIRSRCARAFTATLLAVALVATAPLPARGQQVPEQLPEQVPFIERREPVRPTRPPPDRNLVLLFNVAGPAGNPFDGDRGWRLEASIERRPEGRLSSAVVIGGGSVAVKGYPEEWALGFSGQGRWYALGDFDRGLFVGGVLDFRRIGPHLMCGAGPLVGYRHTTARGVAAEVHLGLPLLADSFSSDAAGRVPLRDAWRAMLPGVFVGVGAALRTGRR
ncbi:hypothetical protein [Anaeromyxobacter soli]|uniref:hypothetical protein n=2 Tax=Anaeromyxobacter TaxID=161492 RepID=UPI001FAF59B8|nr:hypothetical protein [Anaeromyxobacter sp. SG29]